MGTGPLSPTAVGVSLRSAVLVDTTGDGAGDSFMDAAAAREQAAAAARMQAAFRGQHARQAMEVMGMGVGMHAPHGSGMQAAPPGGARRASEVESTEARTALSPGTPEYEQAASYFRQKLAPSEAARVQIHSIERLHVRDTLDAYELIMKQMTRREDKRRQVGRQSIDASALELKWVFHACAAEAVDNIICGGFNRSYAGKNATVYGPRS